MAHKNTIQMAKSIKRVSSVSSQNDTIGILLKGAVINILVIISILIFLFGFINWYLLSNIEHFCGTLLSGQRLQMEKLWIEYLLRDTIVERGAGSSFNVHKCSHFPIYNLHSHCLRFPQFGREGLKILLWRSEMPTQPPQNTQIQIQNTNAKVARSENIVVKERSAPPFPLKILTSNFGQTLNLYCLGHHNNMEMDGMAPPNCAAWRRCTS